MLLLYCSSYGNEKCCTLIVLKFEKPHCLNSWSLRPCDDESAENAWVIGRLFRKCLIIFQQKMACWNRNVLQLKDQWAAHNDSGTITKHLHLLYLLPNTTVACSHRAGPGWAILLYETSILKSCSTFCMWKVDRNGPGSRQRKWSILHAMGGVSMAVIKTALQSVAFAPQFQSTPTMMKTVNRWNFKPTLIPQSFWQVSQCWQICPHRRWAAEKFGQPWLCSRHVDI
jgi:hypothetical protein